ncbi:MAG: hypothetical protein JWO15_2495 [Sphingomonadales bacterium]|nr:hypothetical protein [Sphingomonadales bacterium]
MHRSLIGPGQRSDESTAILADCGFRLRAIASTGVRILPGCQAPTMPQMGVDNE